MSLNTSALCTVHAACHPQRAYPVLDRVREKKLLTKTAEVGLLSALEDAGLTLSQAEALLPAIEEAGLLSFAANNADFLLNTAGFLVSATTVIAHGAP
jgi:Protein of unknown function (DUF1118)